MACLRSQRHVAGGVHSLVTAPWSGAVFVRRLCSRSGLITVRTLRGPLPAAVWGGADSQRHHRGIPLNNTPRRCSCHSARHGPGGARGCSGYVRDHRKGFMKVKAKLRAMNIRYMLLYRSHLKVISGGKSHFFDRPEEVWRWLEMWDIAAPSRTERIGLTVCCPLGPASPDWRSRGERQLEGTVEQVVDIVAPTRVEIQQDGIMAVVTPGSTDGSMGTTVPGVETVPVET
ncbi:hypothetical protein NDU88_001279 [Pleurodeles waltl]|uniref:Uncharacterized protein n=1 Tax=Pleurodeles waltl TaxID=8319 RepID=A0AAV7LX77_PLEWA|nr:hypothetical protein NDU88_001279 [Pleurodeles waltl]